MERNNKRKCRKKRERGGNIKHSLYPSWKIVLVNVCSIGILFIDNGYKSSFSHQYSELQIEREDDQ